MENKRDLKVRISILYIVYFAALLGGIIYNTGPAFKNGAKLGFEISQTMMNSIDDQTMRRSNLYIGVPVEGIPETGPVELDDSKHTSLTFTTPNVNIIATQDVSADTPIFDLIFSSIGGSAALYFSSMAIMLLYIAIFVLTFLILHSLRRSVKNDIPLAKRCVWYTRTIGLILIVADILDTWGRWTMAKGAAKVLEGTDFTVDTSFTPNYYTLLLAVLVIFTAEIFAIGSHLGEEQKLTI